MCVCVCVSVCLSVCVCLSVFVCVFSYGVKKGIYYVYYELQIPIIFFTLTLHDALAAFEERIQTG